MSDLNEERRGGRPRTVDTPEFQAAVAAQVAEQVAAARAELEAQIAESLPRLLAQFGPQVPAPQGVDSSFAKGLALEIAKMNGQMTGREYIDPVELEKRENAMAALVEKINEYRAAGIVPAWRVVQKTQLVLATGPQVVDPIYRDRNRNIEDTEIGYCFVPNLAMRPIDDHARALWDLFRDAIGGASARGWPSDDEKGDYAIDRAGNVVRGPAATAVLRNERSGLPHLRPAEAPINAATIHRGDAPKRKINVLGSITPPVEIS